MRTEMSNEPVAICENTQIGLPCCSKGEGKYCYWKKPCSSQMRLTNPKRKTLQAEALYRLEQEKALKKAREISDQEPLFETNEFEQILEYLKSQESTGGNL